TVLLVLRSRSLVDQLRHGRGLQRAVHSDAEPKRRLGRLGRQQRFRRWRYERHRRDKRRRQQQRRRLGKYRLQRERHRYYVDGQRRGARVRVVVFRVVVVVLVLVLVGERVVVVDLVVVRLVRGREQLERGHLRSR